MTSARGWRRGVVATLVALGLLLMHGGVGVSSSCMQVQQDHTHGTPVMTHAAMCVSTPAKSDSAGAEAAPVGSAWVVERGHVDAAAVVTLASASTDRAPPARDPVSELCVNRT